MLEDLQLTIELVNHLHYNFYPPLPTIFAPMCQEAVEYARCGALDYMLSTPEGYLWRGKEEMSVRDVIEAFRLEDMIESEEL